MKWISIILCLLGGLMILANDLYADEPEAVASVNLDRYLGLWYEIARLPNRFQRSCDSGVTAEYKMRDDGDITVINRCLKADGDKIETKGIAKIADTQSNAKLKVSFVRFLGRNWFWGDYRVIGLDKDYNWAIVGEGSRGYGWILSRTPTIEQSVRDTINTILRDQGYDPTQFIDTRQTKN